jgi:phytoene dehydrogenase-like protein
MSKFQFDTIVIGAGIAGLGVAAILAKEGKQKVLLLERHPQTGGRLMNFSDFPSPGWKLDVGLHFIELGPKSAASELGRRVGREISWPVYSETVQFFQEGGWKSLAELVPMGKEDRDFFRQIVGKIASLTDTEIEAWDNRSLECHAVRRPHLKKPLSYRQAFILRRHSSVFLEQGQQEGSFSPARDAWHTIRAAGKSPAEWPRPGRRGWPFRRFSAGCA